MTEDVPEVSPLVAGVDYLVEGGLLVFTAHYLKRRGTCCGSGCRNCPYGPVASTAEEMQD